MKITRIDNDNGKESLHDIDEACDRLEGSGYFLEGTVDECIRLHSDISAGMDLMGKDESGDGEGFVLRTPWAHWRFEL